MKTVKIYGASDDLVETSGIKGCDEFGCYSSDELVHTTLAIVTQTEGVHVYAIYDGCWSFAVSPAMDSEQLPDWPIRHLWGGGSDYSETLEIDVPDDAELSEVEK